MENLLNETICFRAVVHKNKKNVIISIKYTGIEHNLCSTYVRTYDVNICKIWWTFCTYISRHVLIIFHSDIDECERGTDGCDHNCTNTDGSYYCTCMDGYELESDNHTCAGNVYVHACVIHMHISTLFCSQKINYYILRM